MRPTDEKKYTLVSRKPSRRGISARDFTLPKPYRKPVPGDQQRGRSRLRQVLLAFSGLLIASLIAALAILAHENATSPHALAIVEATKAQPKSEPRKAGSKGKTTAAAAAAAPAMAEAAPADTGPALEEPPPAMPFDDAAPGFAVEELQQDPDVVLITAILLLSAAPVAEGPVCSTLPLDAHGCSAMHAMDP